jgi:choline dehydrogenase-like flavoprotein
MAMQADEAGDGGFDYVIVGGGSAGCVLAARLTEDPAVRVALLEAGPPDDSALIQCPAGLAALAMTGQANWGFSTVPQAGLNGRRGFQPRGKVLGGSSSVNAMIYLRGQREDFDGWAAAGNPGWGWDDVLPWFKHAEHNTRGADAWHGQGGPLHVQDLSSPNPLLAAFIEAGMQAGWPHNPDFNGERQEGVGAYQVTHRQGERCSAAKAYLGPALGRANLTVITSFRATRLLLSGRRVVGVEGIHGRQRRTLTARHELLLSAGALQSPQLLMLSGIGPADELQRHGVPVQHALPGVGRALHDHPDVVLVRDGVAPAHSFGLSLRGAWRAAGGAWQWARHRRGLLTTNFAEGGAFLRSQPGEATPDLQLHFVVGKLVDHGRQTVFGHGISCHVCLLRPKSRGRVGLTSADPFASPAIDPNFLANPDDLARLVRGFKLTRQLLAQPAMTRMGGREDPVLAAAVSDAQIADYIRNHADTVYHPVGSCRMGTGADAVVDDTLRVHGLAGMRVVDASVMPQITSGNTNAPVIMIAERAAAMVAAARAGRDERQAARRAA